MTGIRFDPELACSQGKRNQHINYIRKNKVDQFFIGSEVFLAKNKIILQVGQLIWSKFPDE